MSTYAYVYARPVVVADSGARERLAFVARVYGLLFLSMIVAACGAFLGLTPRVVIAVARYFVLFALLELGMIALASAVQSRRGLNVLALFAFTFVSGMTLGPMLAVTVARVGGHPATILEALGLTIFVFLGLSLYAVGSRSDFSRIAASLVVGACVVLGVGILNLFSRSEPVQLALATLAVIVFSGFVLRDTGRLMYHLYPHQTVEAALSLYLDFLNIFVALLRLLNWRR